MASKLQIPTRDELVRQYERDYQILQPDALVGDGTVPTADAKLLADQHLPLWAEASSIGGNNVLADKTSEDLEQTAEDLGLPRRLEAIGASGFLNITTSFGGAHIQVGTIAKNRITGFRYQCTVDAIYTTGDLVPVQCVDTGSPTNLVPDTLLDWQSPPAGLATSCSVATQSNGDGLTGGHAAEEDHEIVARIIDVLSNPPLSGNAADYRDAMRAVAGVALQEAFVYPAIQGPGSIGTVFTLRPDKPGASRIPNPAQVAAVRAGVIGKFPTDDSVYAGDILGDPVDLVIRVRWKRGPVGWYDGTQWPKYDSTIPTVAPVTVNASPAPTATVFKLDNNGVQNLSPPIGSSIAFLDRANNTYVRKRVLGVTGASGGPWTVTCDPNNGASNTSFVPAAGDPVSPWSDALDLILIPILTEVDKLGPGEQLASFFDSAGLRQKRVPDTGVLWANELSGRAIAPLYQIQPLEEVQVQGPAFPYVVPVGTLGVSSNLIEINTLTILPL